MRRPTVKLNGKYLAANDPRRGCILIGSTIGTVITIVFVIAIFAFVFITGGFESDETSSTNEPSTKYKYHITVIDEDGEILHDKDHKEDTAWGITRDFERSTKLVQKEGIILEMCGKRHNPAENKYWTYTVNGKEVNERPGYYYPEAGDDIVFTLEVVEP